MHKAVPTHTRLTGATILFVSADDADCRRFMSEMADAGIRATTVHSAAEALSALRERTLSVLVTRVLTQGLDGMRLVELATKIAPEVACIVMMDLPLSSTRFRPSLDHEVMTVVGKPWNRSDMLETVRNALALHIRRVKLEQNASSDVRVLLVEDDYIAARSVIGQLALQAGATTYIVEHVTTLQGGLDLLHEATYDVILSGLTLPDGDAFDWVLGLQSGAPDTAIVVFSDIDSDDLALRAVEQGAQDFLVKGTVKGPGIARAIRFARARKKSEQTLKLLAHFDALTGLANRRTLHKRMSLALARCRRIGGGLSVLFMDLDRFKEFNDTYGHALGDALLAEVGVRIRSAVRDYDTPARIGGDEFVILLDTIEDPGVAERLAQRLLDTVASSVRLRNITTDLTASIGIATYPTHGATLDALLNAADQALYAAKQGGRNCVRVSSTVAEQDKGSILQADLRHALDRDEYLLYYQPLVDATTTETVAFEALLRWKRNGEIIPPYVFIPMLERSGQIVEVGQWVLETAAARVKRWRDAGQPALRMAVNLSARQFERDRLVPTVLKALRDNDLPADALELEITESLLMRDTDRTYGLLSELRDIGVRISIDDFGTGYSSLAYLQRFPVDTLKVDRSFVSAISNSKDDAAITSAIINLGQTLGLEIVAEGVEELAQVDFLRAAGCTTLQGYYFGRPEAEPERVSTANMAPVV